MLVTLTLHYNYLHHSYDNMCYFFFFHIYENEKEGRAKHTLAQTFIFYYFKILKTILKLVEGGLGPH